MEGSRPVPPIELLPMTSVRSSPRPTTWILVACASVLAALLAAAPAPAAYPPPTQLTPAPTPQLPLPGYLQPIVDPTFGTTVTRISDRGAFHRPNAPALRHGYSKRQPWNSDQSLLLLDWTYPAALLDGQSYELRGWLPLPSEALWSHTDPDRMLGIRGRRLVWYDVTTQRSTTLHRFGRYGRILIGAGEGNLSNDDRYVALFGQLRSHRGRDSDVIVFDTLQRRVVATRRFHRSEIGWADTATFDNVTVSQLGGRVILSFAHRGRIGRRGVWSFDLNLRDRRLLAQHGGSHFDSCIDAAGREVIVITGPEGLVSVDLETGERRLQLPAELVSWPIHISCRNIERPGWAYVSEFYDPDEDVRPNHDEVFALRLDGSGVVERFAHEHYSTREAYPREPHAAPSPDGERVLWASDWGRRRGPIYAYVAEQR